MKKHSLIALFLSVVLLLSACGGASVTESLEDYSTRRTSGESCPSSEKQTDDEKPEKPTQSADNTPASPIPEKDNLEAVIDPPLESAYASRLPYSGAGTPELTKSAAEAYAEVLRLRKADADAQEIDMTYHSYREPFSRVAFFDAGGSVPGMISVNGLHYYYNSEYGYMAYSAEIYTYDGKNAVRALSSDYNNNVLITSDGVVLDGSYPEWYWADHFASRKYGFNNGSISLDPVETFEFFAFYTDSAPTAEMLSERIDAKGEYPSYDFSTATDDKWQEYYGSWYIVSVNGEFMSYDSAKESGLSLIYADVESPVGEGQCGHQDVDQTWWGDWITAWEAIALLAGEEPTAEPNYVEELMYTVGDISVYRDTLKQNGLDLSCYLEYPVINRKGESYDKINAYFTDMRDAFFIGEQSRAADLYDMVSEYYSYQTGTYLYELDLSVCDTTEDYISFNIAYSWWMGGTTDYGVDGYNFDAKTGERITLPDLFPGMTNDELCSAVAAALENEYPELLDYPAPINAVLGYDAHNFDFYISEGTVTVFFDKYEIAAGAAGTFAAELALQIGL